MDFDIRIFAGHLDDLDDIIEAERHVSSWRTCLRVEIVSKGVWQHVHPCIAQMQVSHPRQLLILAWKMESAVKYFAALENQWLNEPDSLQQKTLYKSVFDAEVTFAIKFGLIHSYDVLEQENPRNVYMLSWLVRELQRSFGVGHMILDFAQEHSVFNVFQVDASLCRDDACRCTGPTLYIYISVAIWAQSVSVRQAVATVEGKRFLCN